MSPHAKDWGQTPAMLEKHREEVVAAGDGLHVAPEAYRQMIEQALYYATRDRLPVSGNPFDPAAKRSPIR